MIDALEKKFQHRYGSNWKYTPRQREILRTLDKSFSVLNCVAGSGKTTLLVSLALWMLADKAKGGKGSLHYMTETQEMVNEFVNLVREVHGDNAGIAVIGYDREAGVDRLDAHLRERLEQKKIPLAKTIGKLSDALDFLRAQASTMFTESSTKNPDVDAEDEVDAAESWYHGNTNKAWCDEDTKENIDMVQSCSENDRTRVLYLFKLFLVVHHMRLHRGFYVQMREAQSKELANLTVIACTTATASRLNGGSNPWSKTFGKLNKTLAVADEIQNLGRVECAGLAQ